MEKNINYAIHAIGKLATFFPSSSTYFSSVICCVFDWPIYFDVVCYFIWKWVYIDPVVLRMSQDKNNLLMRKISIWSTIWKFLNPTCIISVINIEITWVFMKLSKTDVRLNYLISTHLDHTLRRTQAMIVYPVTSYRACWFDESFPRKCYISGILTCELKPEWSNAR